MKTYLITIVAITLCTASILSAQEPPPPESRPPLAEEEIFSFLEAHQLQGPIEGLTDLKQHEPTVYQNELINWSERIRHYRELEKNEPAVAKALFEAERLDQQCWELAQQIAQTDDDAKKARMLKELKTKLGKIFDARLSERELEVKHLRAELQRIEGNLDRRRAARDQIIQRRATEMTAQADETMSWW